MAVVPFPAVGMDLQVVPLGYALLYLNNEMLEVEQKGADVVSACERAEGSALRRCLSETQGLNALEPMI